MAAKNIAMMGNPLNLKMYLLHKNGGFPASYVSLPAGKLHIDRVLLDVFFGVKQPESYGKSLGGPRKNPVDVCS